METFELGPFELVDYVGEGTMGRVYRGRHPRSGVDVAVKVMTSDLAREAYFRRGFRREIQAMAQLTHPAVAAVYDLGEIDAETSRRAEGLLPEGSPWLAMEYIQGISASELPESWGWHRIRWVLLEVLDALAHSHAVGVIHRDLKPSNILVHDIEASGLSPKIVDFGVARILDPDREAQQHDIEERIAGTPKYMAPEQVLGRRRRQGPWTDLYAIGCLGWTLLTGRPPFDEGSVEELFEQHLRAPLPEFEPRLGVPEGVEQWLRGMLRKDPYCRFLRAADASHALLELSGLTESSEPQPRSSGVMESRIRSTTDVALAETAVGGSRPDVEVDDGVLELDVPRGERSSAVDRWALPPIPEDWRLPGDRERFEQLRGAGLGLFGLRRIPIVDREAERSLLWRHLLKSAEESKPTMLLVHGPTGAGRDRLARWLSRRAHEVGAAHALHARHSSRGGPRDGVGPMLGRFFRVVGLEPEAMVERLERAYAFLDLSGPDIHHDIRGLAQWIGGEEAFGGGFETPEARFRAVERLLRHLGRLRPTILWLEDVDRGPESLAFVEHLLEETDGDFPVAVVATGAEDVFEQESDVGERLRRLRTKEGVQFERVGGLEFEAQRRLVEQLLGFEPSTAEQVARRTEGNPMFAIQLIQDWIEREMLERTDHGYAVADEASVTVPDGVRQLWEQRIDATLERVDLDDQAAGRRALELVAAFGTGVTHEEWLAISRRAGLGGDEGLVDDIYRHGLAERRDDGWRLAHELLRETLEREAREAGRWTELQETAADILLELYDLETSGVPRRVAEHLQEAGELEAALHYFHTAARRALDAAEYAEARRLIQNQRLLIDALDDGTERFEIRFLVARGELQGQVGEPNRALDWVEEAVELARRAECGSELGAALRLRASLFREMGQLDGALEDAREALQRFEETTDRRGIARAQHILGRIHQVRGEIERAERRYRRALEGFEAVGDPSMKALAVCELGYLAVAEEAHETARERLETSLDLAREVGNRRVAAKSWNRLGEIARFEENREEARRCYRKAEELFEVPRNRHVANLNLAFVELADGKTDEAESYLVLLEKSFETTGIHYPQVMLGLSCCDAVREDWEDWDRDFDAAVESLEASGMAHADLPWLAEKSAKLCRYGGETERARRALALAAYQSASLGDHENAKALKSLVDALGE